MIRPLSSPALLALLGLTGGLTAAGTEPTAEAPKTHTLFMGANLSVVSAKATLPVIDIGKDAYVVKAGKEPLVVRATDRGYQLKIDDTLKLATICATIDHLAFDRTYTPANDPMTRMVEANRVEMYAASTQDLAYAEMRNAQSAVGYNSAQAEVARNSAGPDGALAAAPYLAAAAAASRDLSQAQSNLTSANALRGQDAFSGVSNSTIMTGQYAEERFDALNISFELSSPRPLAKPYVVIIMRYLAEKDQPDSGSVLVYAEKLSPIDEHPHKYRFRRAGLPPGYQIVSHQIHLYDGTEEIATTVARKQVALTTEEAFDYAVIAYIGDNRDKTMSPARARAFWPADLHTRFVPEKLGRSLYAKVGQDGKALGLYEDDACARPVADADLAALTSELRFLPALDRGKPIVGVAPVKLGRLN